VAFITGTAILGTVVAVTAFIGISVYKINHAVHHVAIGPALLAQGHNDLLAVVTGPDHQEQIYVFRATDGHTKVLRIPSDLGIEGAAGRSVPLSSLNIHRPAPIIEGLRKLGIPVGRYVGVDLHAANPTSSLGRLSLGKVSMTSLISHPAGTASLLEAVASHVYLGPNTSVSSLLTLMHASTGTPVSVPTSTAPDGRVVLAAPADGVLRHFL
jgi:hypothetical protein